MNFVRDQIQAHGVAQITSDEGDKYCILTPGREQLFVPKSLLAKTLAFQPANFSNEADVLNAISATIDHHSLMRSYRVGDCRYCIAHFMQISQNARCQNSLTMNVMIKDSGMVSFLQVLLESTSNLCIDSEDGTNSE